MDIAGRPLAIPLLAALALAACAGDRARPPPRAEALAAGGATPAEDRLWPITDGVRIGFIDRAGKVVAPPRYGFTYGFTEGRAAVTEFPLMAILMTGAAPPGFTPSPPKFGFIDATGREVVPLVYDVVESFSEGLAVVRKHGKLGYIDLQGQVRIPLELDEAEHFSDGLAFVRDARGSRFIDRTGKTVLDVGALRYVAAGRELRVSPFRHFSEGLVECELVGEQNPNRRGFMDRTGRVAIEPRFMWVYPMRDGLSLVDLERANALDRASAIIDRTGKYLIPPEWSPNRKLHLPSAGLVRFDVNSGPNTRSGFLNERGEVALELKYDDACLWFKDGLCPVRRGKTWAYIDVTGREAIVLPPDTKLAFDFKDGIALVASAQGWRFIRRDGTSLLDAPFADRAWFDGDLARIVLQDHREAYVDGQGRIVYRSEKPLERWSPAFELW